MTSPARPGRRLAAIGGLILLVVGLLIAGIGIGAATAEPVEGMDFGRAVAPFVMAFAVPPLIAALGIFRHQRPAYILGVIIGVVYGASLVALGRGQPSPSIVGLMCLGAAVVLIDAFRRTLRADDAPG